MAAFPSHSAPNPEVLPAIEIPNPWAGPETYAEDYYAGGDINLVPGQSVDPNHLGEEDEDSNEFIITTDNGETAGSAISEDVVDGDQMVEGTTSLLKESTSVEVIIVDSDQESAPGIETSMQEAKPSDNQGELESDNLVPSSPLADRSEMEIGASPEREMDIDSIIDVDTGLKTASEEATAHEGSFSVHQLHLFTLTTQKKKNSGNLGDTFTCFSCRPTVRG